MPSPDHRPRQRPIGMQIGLTAKALSRAFGDALAAEGGAEHTWQILLALKMRPVANQREIAAAVGIQGATLTHHLNGMERDGLLTRRRDPENRRVHVVELSESGEALFLRLRDVAVAFDARLRDGVDEAEVAVLRDLLGRLEKNVG